MKKKRKLNLTSEFWAKNAEHRKLLEERLAYHEARIAAAKDAGPEQQTG
jgi:hypothetical protein